MMARRQLEADSKSGLCRVEQGRSRVRFCVELDRATVEVRCLSAPEQGVGDVERSSCTRATRDDVSRCIDDGDMGDAHVGLQARLMSQALRKLTASVSKTKCIVVFINQLREKIGIMFGNPETTTGGRALKFYASIRMDVRRIETLKAGGDVIGNRAKIKIVKNKVAPPFKETQFDIMFGKGISRSGDILDLAVENSIIEKSGAWFAYNGEKIGQGRENAKLYLENNPDIMYEIEQKVRGAYGLETDAGFEAADTESTAEEENSES